MKRTWPNSAFSSFGASEYHIHQASLCLTLRQHILECIPPKPTILCKERFPLLPGLISQFSLLTCECLNSAELPQALPFQCQDVNVPWTWALHSTHKAWRGLLTRLIPPPSLTWTNVERENSSFSFISLPKFQEGVLTFAEQTNFNYVWHTNSCIAHLTNIYWVFTM